MPLAVDAAAPGPRAEAQPPNLETRNVFGVAHKGSALKVSRGLNFTFQGDAICHERGVPTTRYTQATIIGISGSGIAQPASPIKDASSDAWVPLSPNRQWGWARPLNRRAL
jgi:hypothetical protein